MIAFVFQVELKVPLGCTHHSLNLQEAYVPVDGSDVLTLLGTSISDIL